MIRCCESSTIEVEAIAWSCRYFAACFSEPPCRNDDGSLPKAWMVACRRRSICVSSVACSTMRSARSAAIVTTWTWCPHWRIHFTASPSLCSLPSSSGRGYGCSWRGWSDSIRRLVSSPSMHSTKWWGSRPNQAAGIGRLFAQNRRTARGSSTENANWVEVVPPRQVFAQRGSFRGGKRFTTRLFRRFPGDEDFRHLLGLVICRDCGRDAFFRQLRQHRRLHAPLDFLLGPLVILVLFY